MTVFAIRHKKSSDEIENRDLEVKIKNQISAEYQEAYFLKRKKDLLFKANVLPPVEKIIPHKTGNWVHMSYLNRSDTCESPDNN